MELRSALAQGTRPVNLGIDSPRRAAASEARLSYRAHVSFVGRFDFFPARSFVLRATRCFCARSSKTSAAACPKARSFCKCGLIRSRSSLSSSSNSQSGRSRIAGSRAPLSVRVKEFNIATLTCTPVTRLRFSDNASRLLRMSLVSSSWMARAEWLASLCGGGSIAVNKSTPHVRSRRCY